MDFPNCPKCNDEVRDGAFCNQCSNYLHFGCACIQEIGYRRLGKEKIAAWRCPDCRSSPPESKLVEILAEMKSFRASVEPKMEEVSTQILALNKKFDDLDLRIKGTDDRLSKAEKTILELKQQNNDQDQFSRMNNVEISGIPSSKGENLYSILGNISAKLGFTLRDTDVDTIHRVRRFTDEASGGDGKGARLPAIVVRFTQRLRKDELLAAARTRRGLSTADLGFSGPSSKVYLNEHLTPANKLLLKQARELKSELNYTYLWIRDCKILMRKNNETHSKIIRIANEGDLKKLK